MCGISGIFGNSASRARIEAMIATQQHRGPDAEGAFVSESGIAAFGHNRLSIIDTSSAGIQPMTSPQGRYHIVFNGEIYNYRELKAELSTYPYHSETDTEVILAAYIRWGSACLSRFRGMFALMIWDEQEQTLFAARDRFGVKPLYYSVLPDGTLLAASEIKALHAGGVKRDPDVGVWASYLAHGTYSVNQRTFWSRITALPEGHSLTWNHADFRIEEWYSLAKRVGLDYDTRSIDEVAEEYMSLLTESVKLRFRSDVPVGINLSGGLDSSLLLGRVQRVQGAQSDVSAYTFITGDPGYDELEWVRAMLMQTQHPSRVALLQAAEVPALAESVQACQDEPFGGLPTLAYAKLFELARLCGTTVLLDGQGLDEQWAGYDYYANQDAAKSPSLVQGSKSSPVKPACLSPEFLGMAEQQIFEQPFPDNLRNTQYRDICYTKIPRALRFNDRASMRSSIELREPFLDHLPVELALRQPAEYKIKDGVHKYLPRRIATSLLPTSVVTAPKRPVQTPQREWLRGPLHSWASDCISDILVGPTAAWFDRDALAQQWQQFLAGHEDNSFFVWQWISVALMLRSESMAPVITYV